MAHQVELKSGRHWKCKEHMLCSEFFIPQGSPMLDSSMIIQHIEEVHRYLGEDRLTFLNDLTTSENVLSFEALKKWGQSTLLNMHRIAEAYVVSSLADLIFIKQHIRLNMLDYPAQVFQSLEQAKSWLQTMEKKYHNSR